MASARYDFERRADRSTAPRPMSGQPAHCAPAGQRRVHRTLPREPHRIEPGIPFRAPAHHMRGPAGAGSNVLAGTRQASGIVRAMQPCTLLSQPVAPPAVAARSQAGESRKTGFARADRTGTISTQEDTHGFEAPAPLPGIRASVSVVYQHARSHAAQRRADRNHTVNIKMLPDLFSLPRAGRYPLASYIHAMACNSLNGATNACGR